MSGLAFVLGRPYDMTPLLAAILAAAPAAAPPGDPPDAAALVRDYLKASDSASRRLVVERVRSSNVSVADLVSVIREARDLEAASLAPDVHRLSMRIEEDGSSAEYLLAVPPGADRSRPLPLLVSMHGTGGRGEDCLRLWRDLASEAGFLLACPTATVFREKGWGSSPIERSQILSLVADVGHRCRVDSDRIYLGGWSMGGHGSFDLGVHHPDRFAALNPAIGSLARGLLGLVENLKPVPIFLVSGALDQDELVERQRDVVALLTKKGGQVVHREHADGGHEFFPEDLPEILEWLKPKARAPLPPLVRHRLNDVQYGRCAWLRADELTSDAREPGEGVQLRAGHKLSDKEVKQRYLESLEKTSAQIEGKRVDGTHLSVTTRFVAKYSVLVLDGLVDASKILSIVTNGRPSFSGKVTPDPALLLEDFRRTADRSRIPVAAVSVSVPNSSGK